MNKGFMKTLCKAVVILCVVVIIDILGVAFLALKTVSIPFVPNRNIDNMSDYYIAVWDRVKGNPVDNRFVVIDITENSRREIAEILNAIKSMNPAIIGLDVSYIWEENPSEDSLLVQTIRSIPNIILPVEYYTTEKGNDAFLYSIFQNQLIGKEYGVVSFPENRDVLRTYKPCFKFEDRTIGAFGCVIAKKCGADISNLEKRNSVLINFTTLKLTDDEAIPGFQFLNLDSRNNQFRSSQIANKIVLIGSTNQTRDQHLTPLGNLSGVMIHAHIINSLMENKRIRETPLLIRYFLCFAVAIVVLMWCQKSKKPKETNNRIWKTIVIWSALFCASVVLFAVIGTFLFCRLCYYIDFSPYIVTLIVTFLIKDRSIGFKELRK